MRIAFISDIHEDYPYLKKILKKAREKGYDQLYCLGDISGFCKPYYHYPDDRDAPACLDILREHGAGIVPGNHDLHAVARIPRHSDIFDFPPDWYSMSKSERLELSKDLLWNHDEDLMHGYSHEDMKFIRLLPEYRVLETGREKILISHYAYPNLSGFRQGFFSWEMEFRDHFCFMKALGCSLAFTGHAHPRGFYYVTSSRFRQFRYRKLKLTELRTVIGIPPVTRQYHRSGFCIYDSDSHSLQTHKL